VYDISKSSGSTDNFWNHYKKHHEINQDNLKTSLATCFDKEEFVRLLASWVCSNMHSFTIVEEDAFRTMVSFLNASAEIPSADTIKNRVLTIYEEKKSFLIEKFATIQYKLAFTIDVWTALNTTAYMGVTVHFIDDNFKMNHFLIDFVHLQSNHSGVELGQAFVSVLRKFNLEKKVNLILTS
jgi:hypothetical protein